MDFRILGPLEVRRNGERVALGGPRQRALLALLLLRADRVVSRDRLIDELWAGDAPAGARHTLEVTVSRLRKALGANGSGGCALLTRAPGYVLRVEPGELDLHRFERLLADGRRAFEAGDSWHAANRFQEAEGLWRGPPLADLELEPSLRGELERLEELHLVAGEERIEAELALGRHRRLIPELEILQGEHPLRERLGAQLMLSLYRSGRQADALAAYRRVRSVLVEEIGVEPGPELRTLQAAILRHDPTLLAPTRAELPPQLDATSPLIGRDAELARLRDIWEQAADGAGGVAVLSGPVGSGRTRLAAELAVELHRQGALVLYGSDSLAQARAVQRPTLVVLDDVRAGSALAELAGELASRPVLALAISDSAGLADALPAAQHVSLGPLSPHAIAGIAALYAPDGARVPVADLTERSRGLPRRAHRLAAEWARAEAARRLRRAADRTAAERSVLRRGEAELAASVADVQAVHDRAGLHGADAAVPACPFKGLASFDVGDADVFFGRERLVAEMTARLAGAPLLAVVGASGSGKSSALRAGLLAQLAGGVLPGSERWLPRVLRPGERPMAALERAGTHEPHRHVLLVVDQFEECFTLCREEAERRAFIDALVAAARADRPEPAVVVALRADFYARCAAYPELARLLAANQVLVGPMQRDELRRAIERPARRSGVRVEPELVDRLLSEVEHEPGALPLLSTALLELWERREGRSLTLALYERTGGVRGAIARLAEAAFARLAPTEQAIARRILLRLAGESAGGGAVRRRTPLDELEADRGEDAARVLDRLAGSRLVTVDAESVEVAHEALLREWPRLRGWLDEDSEGRRLHHQLAGAARDWQAAGRDPSELYRGARLAVALEWASTREDALNAVERAFLDAGRIESEADAERTRRTNRRLRALLATVVLLLVVAGAAGVLFIGQRGEARDQARAADARHLGAQALVDDNLDRAVLLARQGVALEDSVETRGNLLAALLRSPAAVGVHRIGRGHLNTMAMRPDGRALVVGDEHGDVAFMDPVTGRALRHAYRTHTPYVRQLVFSPDGSRLAVGGLGAISLLDGPTFRELAVLDVPGRDLQFINVAFSPDGRVLVVMYVTHPREPDAELVLLRFDGRSGRRLGGPVSVDEPDGQADVTAFTPRGRELITVDRDPVALAPGADSRGESQGRAIVLRDARTLRPLRRYPGFAWSGALSPDGATFAAGDAEGSVRFIDLQTGAQHVALGRHTAAVSHALFTPDGRFLVTAGEDATAIVWDVAARAALETFAGHAGRVAGLALDPRGHTLYTAAADGTVITWDLAGSHRLGRPFDAGSGSDYFPSTAVDRDGRTLVTAQDDGSVSVVDTRTLVRRRLTVAGSPAASAPSSTAFTPSAPAFGPPGTLVVSSLDGFLALVDARTGRITGRLRGHRNLVLAPSTSADGRIIASAGFDETARLWDARTRRQIGPPIPFSSPFGSVALDPGGSRVAVTEAVGTIDVLDVRSQRRLAHLAVDESPIVAARFTRDGRLLLTGSRDGRVRIFSARDWSGVSPTFPAHASAVTSIDSGRDDRTLVTAAADGQVRLWDLASHRPIGTPLSGPKDVNAAAEFSPDGREVFTVFANGQGYRWDVRPSAWKRHACTLAGRRLTRAEWRNALPDRDYAPAC